MKEGQVDPMYEERVLVFIESLEEGTFRQVLLNGKQFKKVSDAILTDEWDKEDLKPGFRVAEIQTGDKEISADTFIGMESISEDE